MEKEESDKIVLESVRKTHMALGETLYSAGNKIAAREGYKTLTGFDSVRFFLMQKHNWLPSTVKSMCDEDLLFALSEEFSDEL